MLPWQWHKRRQPNYKKTKKQKKEKQTKFVLLTVLTCLLLFWRPKDQGFQIKR